MSSAGSAGQSSRATDISAMSLSSFMAAPPQETTARFKSRGFLRSYSDLLMYRPSPIDYCIPSPFIISVMCV